MNQFLIKQGSNGNGRYGQGPSLLPRNMIIANMMTLGSLLMVPVPAAAADGLYTLLGSRSPVNTGLPGASQTIPTPLRRDRNDVGDWPGSIAAIHAISAADNPSVHAAALCDRAMIAALHLRQGGISAPRVTTEDDGEIDFVWIDNDTFSSLSFTSDDHLVGYHSRPSRSIFRLDDPFSLGALAVFHAVVSGA